MWVISLSTCGNFSKIEELRAVFNLSQSVAKRIQDFRIERILNLNSGTTPVSMPKETGKLVVHLIPFQSFNAQTNVDAQRLLKLSEDTNNFRPVHSRGWSYRVNLNGVIAYDGGRDDSYSYVQVYRSGIIEYVDGAILWGKQDQEGNKIIPSRTLEEIPLKGIPLGWTALSRQLLGINFPSAARDFLTV